MAGNTMGMGDAYVSFADELDATDPVGGVVQAGYDVNCDIVNSDAAHLHPIGQIVNAITGVCDDHEAQQGETGPDAQGVDPLTTDRDLGPPVDLDQQAPSDTFELEQPQQPAFTGPSFNF